MVREDRGAAQDRGYVIAPDIETTSSIAMSARSRPSGNRPSGNPARVEAIDPDLNGSVRGRQRLVDSGPKVSRFLISPKNSSASSARNGFASTNQKTSSKPDLAQVPLISIADGINTTETSAKLTYTLKSTVAEIYLDDLRDKTRRGMQGRALHGYATGGIPYGYRTEPEHDARGEVRGYRILIHEEEAEIVRRIFRLYRDGHSHADIAKILNDENVPPPRPHSRRAAGGWLHRDARALDGAEDGGRRRGSRPSVASSASTLLQLDRRDTREIELAGDRETLQNLRQRQRFEWHLAPRRRGVVAIAQLGRGLAHDDAELASGTAKRHVEPRGEVHRVGLKVPNVRGRLGGRRHRQGRECRNCEQRCNDRRPCKTRSIALGPPALRGKSAARLSPRRGENCALPSHLHRRRWLVHWVAVAAYSSDTSARHGPSRAVAHRAVAGSVALAAKTSPRPTVAPRRSASTARSARRRSSRTSSPTSSTAACGSTDRRKSSPTPASRSIAA